MTSTNDGKDVKSNQTSGQKGKTYYIELYKSLEARLSGECASGERAQHVCEAWRRVHCLCLHSAPSTHPHLLSWLQRHTSHTILQTEWQSPKSTEQHTWLQDAINEFIKECQEAISRREGVAQAWETQLLQRACWFLSVLPNPWGHPVLKALLDSRGPQPHDREVLEWLKEERGVMFVTRLRQLAASKCDDLALLLASAVMDRARHTNRIVADADQAEETPQDKPEVPNNELTFFNILRKEAGFTTDIWELLTDIEFVLLYKGESRARCIDLAKQTPLRNGYKLVERLHNRLENSPQEKKLWKNAKDVATLVAQVVIARCMVVPNCIGVARAALYGCVYSLVQLLPAEKLPTAAAALAAPAATSRHLHTLAAAVHALCKDERKPFVCSLYVRAITAGMNELEKLKLETEKASEARGIEQTLASWFIQLGTLLSASSRLSCECTLTAFSVHPSPTMYERVKRAPPLAPLIMPDVQEQDMETNTEYGSWATDSRTQTNLVKTSETLKLKQTQKQANVLSTAIFAEGEGLGLEADLCQDLAVLLSGPRVKTLYWDMDRETLLENCRTYMERTHGGTRALTTELKYLNLDPNSFRHLPEEEDEDENDIYYGIEKGYEHLVEFEEPAPEDIICDNIMSYYSDTTETASCDSEHSIIITKRKKKKNKRPQTPTEEEVDPLSLVSDTLSDKKERPHSKERSKHKNKESRKTKLKIDHNIKDHDEQIGISDIITKEIQKKAKKKEQRERKKKEKLDASNINIKDKNFQSSSNLSKQFLCQQDMKIAKPNISEIERGNTSSNIKSNMCITDSDYDSQGKSSINSEYNENALNDALTDALCSMDELKSVEETPTSYSQRTGFPPCSYSPDTVSSVTGVKKSIQRLIDYRRHKVFNDNSVRQDPPENQSPNFSIDHDLLKNRKPQNINSSVINSKAVNFLNTSHSSVNIPVKQQKVVKNKSTNVFMGNNNNAGNVTSEMKTLNLSCQMDNDRSHLSASEKLIKKGIPKILKSKQPPQVRKHAVNKLSESPSQKQYQEFLLQRKYDDMQDQVHPAESKGQLQFQEFLKKQYLQSTELPVPPSRTQDLPRQLPSQINTTVTPSQKQFHSFLKNLQVTINAGTTNNVQDSKSLPTHDKTTTKKLIQNKKVDNAGNTYARLSYMHKNKHYESKVKSANNPVIQNKPLVNVTTDQIRHIRDIDVEKVSHLQATGEIVLAKIDKPESKICAVEKTKVLVQNIENISGYALNNPVLSNMLSSDKKIMDFTEPGKNDIKFIRQSSNKPKNSTSLLSEKDQLDLLSLLRQQNKLNPPKMPVKTEFLNKPSGMLINSTSYCVNSERQVLDLRNKPILVEEAKSTSCPTSVIKVANNKSLNNGSEPKKNRVKSSKQKVKIESDWKSVMNDILAHKTPSMIGPNALDIVLKKDSFEKRSSESLNSANNRTVITSSKNPNNVTNNDIAKHCTPNTHIKASTSRDSSIILKPHTHSADLKVNQNKVQFTNKIGTVENVKKGPLHIENEHFTSVIQNSNDPFISGIPNSDYDLLEELMDDDLRQEIGELSSDEETYRTPNLSTSKIKNNHHAKECNLPINKANVVAAANPFNYSSISSSDSVRKSCNTNYPMLKKDLCLKNNSLPKTIIQKNSDSKEVNLKPQIISNELITSSTFAEKSYRSGKLCKNASNKILEAVAPNNKLCKDEVSHVKKNPLMTTSKTKNQHSNKMSVNICCDSKPPKTVDNTKMLINDVPEAHKSQNPAQVLLTLPQRNTQPQNVMLIGSTDLIYDPFTMIHITQSTDLNRNTYVAVNQAPMNVALLQSTPFVGPVLSPVIIENTVTLPVIQKVTPNISMNLTSPNSKKHETGPVCKDYQQLNIIKTESIQSKTSNAVHETICPSNKDDFEELKCKATVSRLSAVDSNMATSTPTVISNRIAEDLVQHNSSISNMIPEVTESFYKKLSKQSHPEIIQDLHLDTKSASQVQEDIKDLVYESTDTNTFKCKTVPLDNKTDVIIDQDRIKRKRLLILNKLENLKNSTQKKPIALPYAPIKSSKEYDKNQEQILTNEKKSKLDIRIGRKISSKVDSYQKQSLPVKVDRANRSSARLTALRGVPVTFKDDGIQNSVEKKCLTRNINEPNISKNLSNSKSDNSYTVKIKAAHYTGNVEFVKPNNEINQSHKEKPIFKENIEEKIKSANNLNLVHNDKLIVKASENDIQMKSVETQTIGGVKKSCQKRDNSICKENNSRSELLTRECISSESGKEVLISGGTKINNKCTQRELAVHENKDVTPKITPQNEIKVYKEVIKKTVSNNNSSTEKVLADSVHIKCVDIEEQLKPIRIKSTIKKLTELCKDNIAMVGDNKTKHDQKTCPLIPPVMIKSTIKKSDELGKHKNISLVSDINAMRDEKAMPLISPVLIEKSDGFCKSNIPLVGDDSTTHDKKASPLISPAMITSTIKKPDEFCIDNISVVGDENTTHVQKISQSSAIKKPDELSAAKNISLFEKTVRSHENKVQCPISQNISVKDANNDLIKSTVQLKPTVTSNIPKTVKEILGTDKLNGNTGIQRERANKSNSTMKNVNNTQPEISQHRKVFKDVHNNGGSQNLENGPCKSKSFDLPDAKIMYEDLPNSSNGPQKKCVRIKLPNGNTFKATISGKLNVNIDSIFDDPTVKSLLWKNINNNTKCTLNIKQVPIQNKKDGSILRTEVKDIFFPTSTETINLISDDEEDTSPRNFKTEFGTFNITSMDPSVHVKHQKKLAQKSFVLLERCDALQEAVPIGQANINSNEPDKINMPTEKLVSTSKETVADYIEIDDSSNDSISVISSTTNSNTNNNTTLCSDKVHELKNLLLKDLGVELTNDKIQEVTPNITKGITKNVGEIKNANDIQIESLTVFNEIKKNIEVNITSDIQLETLNIISDSHKTIETVSESTDLQKERINITNEIINIEDDNVTEDNTIEGNMTEDKEDISVRHIENNTKQLILKLKKCDDLVEKLRIKKQKCFVSLIRCDDTSKVIEKKKDLCTYNKGIEDALDDVLCLRDEITETTLKRSNSESILNDLDNTVTIVDLSSSTHNEESSAPMSPSLIDNFETPLILTENRIKDSDVLYGLSTKICDADWGMTKPFLNKYNSFDNNDQVLLERFEVYEKDEDSLTDCDSDHESSLSMGERFQVPSLVKLVINLFSSDFNILERLMSKNLTSKYVKTMNSSPLKRKAYDTIEMRQQNKHCKIENNLDYEYGCRSMQNSNNTEINNSMMHISENVTISHCSLTHEKQSDIDSEMKESRNQPSEVKDDLQNNVQVQQVASLLRIAMKSFQVNCENEDIARKSKHIIQTPSTLNEDFCLNKAFENSSRSAMDLKVSNVRDECNVGSDKPVSEGIGSLKLIETCSLRISEDSRHIGINEKTSYIEEDSTKNIDISTNQQNNDLVPITPLNDGIIIHATCDIDDKNNIKPCLIITNAQPLSQSKIELETTGKMFENDLMMVSEVKENDCYKNTESSPQTKDEHDFLHNTVTQAYETRTDIANVSKNEQKIYDEVNKTKEFNVHHLDNTECSISALITKITETGPALQSYDINATSTGPNHSLEIEIKTAKDEAITMVSKENTGTPLILGEPSFIKNITGHSDDLKINPEVKLGIDHALKLIEKENVHDEVNETKECNPHDLNNTEITKLTEKEPALQSESDIYDVNATSREPTKPEIKLGIDHALKLVEKEKVHDQVKGTKECNAHDLDDTDCSITEKITKLTETRPALQSESDVYDVNATSREPNYSLEIETKTPEDGAITMVTKENTGISSILGEPSFAKNFTGDSDECYDNAKPCSLLTLSDKAHLDLLSLNKLTPDLETHDALKQTEHGDVFNSNIKTDNIYDSDGKNSSEMITTDDTTQVQQQIKLDEVQNDTVYLKCKANTETQENKKEDLIVTNIPTANQLTKLSYSNCRTEFEDKSLIDNEVKQSEIYFVDQYVNLKNGTNFAQDTKLMDKFKYNTNAITIDENKVVDAKISDIDTCSGKRNDKESSNTCEYTLLNDYKVKESQIKMEDKNKLISSLKVSEEMLVNNSEIRDNNTHMDEWSTSQHKIDSKTSKLAENSVVDAEILATNICSGKENEKWSSDTSVDMDIDDCKIKESYTYDDNKLHVPIICPENKLNINGGIIKEEKNFNIVRDETVSLEPKNKLDTGVKIDNIIKKDTNSDVIDNEIKPETVSHETIYKLKEIEDNVVSDATVKEKIVSATSDKCYLENKSILTEALPLLQPIFNSQERLQVDDQSKRDVICLTEESQDRILDIIEQKENNKYVEVDRKSLNPHMKYELQVEVHVESTSTSCDLNSPITMEKDVINSSVNSNLSLRDHNEDIFKSCVSKESECVSSGETTNKLSKLKHNFNCSVVLDVLQLTTHAKVCGNDIGVQKNETDRDGIVYQSNEFTPHDINNINEITGIEKKPTHTENLVSVKEKIIDNDIRYSDSVFQTDQDINENSECIYVNDEINLEKECNESKTDEVMLVYKGDSNIILKGSIYEDPVVGTCYVFPVVNRTSLTDGMNCSNVCDSKTINVIESLKSNVFEECSEYDVLEDVQTVENLNVVLPKLTYSRQRFENNDFITTGDKTNRKNLKRKLSCYDSKFQAKRYRKGKNIDYPKFSVATVLESGYSKEYKRLLDYWTSIKFSYSRPFHKEDFDIPNILNGWPIKETNMNVSDNTDFENILFSEEQSDNKVPFDPSQQTLAQEISQCNEQQYISYDINETNFNMGFGEGSDRVIQTSEDGNSISKISAATLSDVKQSQPFLTSKHCEHWGKNQMLRMSHKHQIEILKRSISYIQLRDKVRSFFKKTTAELNYHWLMDTMKSKYKNSYNNSIFLKSGFPSDLLNSDFIEPAPVETIVQVVQVGQLPVSAAAQNPVTCDPRVTQVTDASPQCSIENSPHDDSQSPIKTEYTELTTADLSLPLVQEYDRHMESQESSKMTNSHHEDIPVETEMTSIVKTEITIELSPLKEEPIDYNDSDDLQSLVNKHINNVDYSFDSNDNSILEPQSNTDVSYESLENNETDFSPQEKRQNGSPEKTDQIAHAMNAAGITTTPDTIMNTRAHPLVNILSQKNCQEGPAASTASPANNYSKAPVNAMTLQQALAQILPPPLNQTNVHENNQTNTSSSVTSQVLHIVQGKNTNGNQITLVDNSQNSVINNSNTPVLHIVQNKGASTNSTSNANSGQHTNSYSGLSLVDTGIQQGSNQLLHIVNTGNQKNNQLLKRVNLLTNLTNVQGSNEQKMVQFVCKSADGKSIHLNAPHQRSMVLRLQPIESPNIQANQKAAECQDNTSASPSSNTNSNTTTNKESTNAQHEIKSRSVYEENYAKFIQNSSNKSVEKSTSLPKFGQAFGKQVFQDGNQKGNDINANNSNLSSINSNSESSECQPNDNSVNLDHIGQLNSPPLLLRKSPSQPVHSQPSQPNLVQQIKQTIAPMNIQTMHGGVIYTRQIPVNIGGGQTINLITVPSTELIDEANQKQKGDVKFVNQNELDSPIIKIVPQNQSTPNAESTHDDTNNHTGMSNESAHTNTPAQHQPVLTQMRIKLPMLSKTPQMVSGARVVRPSFFQIQRNVIGGANQHVYQQLVLTAAPPLGQHTIRLPQAQANRQVTKTADGQSTSEPQMSSSTLEQLREFDMVLEQVKERSTVQPNSNTNNTFTKLLTPTTETNEGTSVTSTVTESTQQVLYSIGSNQSLNVAYINRKTVATTPTTSTFVRSPDSSGIIDSPSSSSHVQIPHTVTSESTLNEASAQPSQPKPAKVGSKSKSRPKSSSNPPSSLKINTLPPKPTQKPLEDEQTTQRILYILAEYKEQVENSPDKDKPAPRRRSNPPTNPSGSSKRKKSSSGSRRPGARDMSPVHGEDTCRTMGSEDSSCGTSQGDCNESCLDSHSPQDSPRKVVRKLTFENETSPVAQPQRPQPQRNVIVADGQTITVARGTAGKPATAVLMPANYILPVSMVKGGQQIAIVTNRGPKLLTVGGGEGGATNALLLQRLIGPAGLKPVLTRPGVRHVRLPTAALHNLQAFNLTTATAVQPPDSTASPAPAPTPPELIETRANSSPWTDRESQDVKPERDSSPEGSEPWNLPSSADPHDYTYEETVRTDNMDRTVLEAIPDRYSPDMEAQRIFDKMFDVESKKSYIDSHDDSSRCAYDIDASDCDDKVYHQVVQKKDGTSQRHHRLTHVSAAALRHKYAILEHELRLQKSLSEECEDLGVDSPSASELFPEAELLFAASPAHDPPQHSHTPQPTILNQSGIPQPDIDDQIATDELLQPDVHEDQQELDVTTLGLDEGIVTVSEDGMQATIQLDQEEFARSHPNTTFHSEPTDEGEVQPFTISGLKGRHITSTIFHAGRAPATVLVTAPQTTVISQANPDHAMPNNVKYANMDQIINSSPVTHGNLNLSSVLVKDDGLTKFDNILTDSRELHLSNTASAIVHATGNATQVIRRVCYEDDKRDTRFLMDEPDAIIAGDDAKMIAEDSSRDATLESIAGDVDDDNSSPERHAELFWESNSASERSESRRPMDFSSDSEKCCKSPSFDETNSTDSSGVGTHMRLDSVIKNARGIERSGSADGSSADDTHPPLRTYPAKRMYHALDGEVERSMSGKTRAGERSPDSLEVRRRASGRGVVKRGCHCCTGSPAPPRPKKPRQRKPAMDFTN
ncbi:uncharacterized protein LOC123877364 isoform X10 [Maniola jurtina]|uniref:uncharacterized protein LOC123877364 isoform X10 n=1 Tax=Maniola jurtina TaxID=191418 RepID=UPI001E689BDA|nr:uncharacterized protein LOC123877364 isoform X10 [Maniola jurtina]